MSTTSPLLALVVPCYNEEEIIGSSCGILMGTLVFWIERGLISEKSFIVFIDDGSKDETVPLLRAHLNSRMRILKLSRNYGHQAAMLAGMQYVTNRCDICLTLDADLQDDVDVVPQMIAHFSAGDHLVYGVRENRRSDGWFKRSSALLFYKIMRAMGIPLIDNHADFRLVSNQILRELNSYKEVNLFLRGIFPLLGFKSSSVFYTRKKRDAGTSKYPFWKMFRLALDGITSFTNFPLKIITVSGSVVFLASIAAGSWVFWVVITGRSVPGWASITLPVYFLGGIQLLGLGVLGEYISKIYLETKARPHYHVEEIMEAPASSNRLSPQSTSDFQKDLSLQKQS